MDWVTILPTHYDPYVCMYVCSPLRKKNQKNVKTKFKSTLTLESYIALFPFELLSNGATIRIGREIQCLPYAGYFYPQLK